MCAKNIIHSATCVFPTERKKERKKDRKEGRKKEKKEERKKERQKERRSKHGPPREGLMDGGGAWCWERLIRSDG